jgi:hypothetical protein
MSIRRGLTAASLLLLAWALAGCVEKPGDLFAKTFGFPLPAGLHVEHERRLITWESLYSHYYGRVAIETPAALETLCSQLSLQRSQSVRSVPMPAPRDVDWWIKLPPQEAMKNPDRFLAEGRENDFVSIYVVGNTAYVFMQGESVRR